MESDEKTTTITVPLIPASEMKPSKTAITCQNMSTGFDVIIDAEEMTIWYNGVPYDLLSVVEDYFTSKN